MQFRVAVHLHDFGSIVFATTLRLVCLGHFTIGPWHGQLCYAVLKG